MNRFVTVFGQVCHIKITGSYLCSWSPLLTHWLLVCTVQGLVGCVGHLPRVNHGAGNLPGPRRSCGHPSTQCTRGASQVVGETTVTTAMLHARACAGSRLSRQGWGGCGSAVPESAGFGISSRSDLDPVVAAAMICQHKAFQFHVR